MSDFVHRDELHLLVDYINDGRKQANLDLKEFIKAGFDHLEDRMGDQAKDIDEVKDDVKSWKRASSFLVALGAGVGFAVNLIFKR